MPQIPGMPQITPAEVGAPQSTGTPHDFGADIGAAVGALGQEIGNLGSSIGGYIAKEKAKTDEMQLAKFNAGVSYQSNFNTNVLNTPNPDGSGLVQSGTEDYNKWVEEQTAAFAKTGASPENVRKFKLLKLQEGPGVVGAYANSAAKMAEAHAGVEIDAAEASIINDIRNNGVTSKEGYITAVTKGEKMYDAIVGMDAATKEVKKAALRNNAAIARFDAMREAATTPDQLAALQKDQHDPFWQKQLQPGTIENMANQETATATNLAKAQTDAQTNPMLNAIRSDPASYDKQLAAGVNAINKSGLKGTDLDERLKNFRSNAALFYFETAAERVATTGTPEQATAGITKLQTELATNKTWQTEFTPQALSDETKNLITRHDQIYNHALEVQKQNDAAYKASVVEKQKVYDAQVTSIEDRASKGVAIPPEDYHALFKARGDLGGNITPEERVKWDKINNQIDEGIRINSGIPLTPAALKARKDQILNGNDHKVSVLDHGHVTILPAYRGGANPLGEGKTGTLFAGAGGNSIPVIAEIGDATAVRGMQPRAMSMMQYIGANAGAVKLDHISITAARGSGHLSHADGMDWDIKGWQDKEEKIPWTPQQRADVARIGAKGGGDRFGLYEGGDHAGTLHIGISHVGFGPGVWGGNNGAVDNEHGGHNFAQPENAQFLRDVTGGVTPTGGSGAGAGHAAGSGNYYTDLAGFESGNRNVVGKRPTKYGYPGGYFQIVTPTWVQYGGLTTGFKTPMEAPYDVQAQIASKIPLGQWAPETLAKMRAKGWTVDPNKTLAENAAANGAGGNVGAGGDVPTGVTAGNQARVEVLDNKISDLQAQIDKSPLEAAAQGPNGIALATLDSQEGWDKRVQETQAVNKLYALPTDKQQFFTPSDVARYDNVLKGGNTDQINQLYASIARIPAAMQELAFRQLGNVNPFGAAAGRLYASNKADLANSATEGHKSIVAMEATGQNAIAWRKDAETWFASNMGDIIRGINPTLIPGLKDVIDGVYMQSHNTRDALNPQDYQAIAEDVVSGTFDKVNGADVIVPEGTTGPQVEQAMGVLDYTAISVTHTPPMMRDIKGTGLVLATPWEMANAHPIRAGTPDNPNRYIFAQGNGALFFTRGQNGVAQTYAATLDAPTILAAAAAAQAAALAASASDHARNPASVSPTEPGQPGQENLFFSNTPPPAFVAPPRGPLVSTPPADYVPEQQPIVPPPNDQTPAVARDASVTAGAAGGANPPMTTQETNLEAQAPGVPTPTREMKTPIGATAVVGAKTGVSVSGGAKQVDPAILEKAIQDNAKTYSEILKRNGASEEYVKRSTEEYISNLRNSYGLK